MCSKSKTRDWPVFLKSYYNYDKNLLKSSLVLIKIILSNDILIINISLNKIIIINVYLLFFFVRMKHSVNINIFDFFNLNFFGQPFSVKMLSSTYTHTYKHLLKKNNQSNNEKKKNIISLCGYFSSFVSMQRNIKDQLYEIFL